MTHNSLPKKCLLPGLGWGCGSCTEEGRLLVLRRGLGALGLLDRWSRFGLSGWGDWACGRGGARAGHHASGGPSDSAKGEPGEGYGVDGAEAVWLVMWAH